MLQTFGVQVLEIRDSRALGSLPTGRAAEGVAAVAWEQFAQSLGAEWDAVTLQSLAGRKSRQAV